MLLSQSKLRNKNHPNFLQSPVVKGSEEDPCRLPAPSFKLTLQDSSFYNRKGTCLATLNATKPALQ